MADPTYVRLKTPMKLGGLLGFLAGFMFAYQRSSSEYFLSYALNANSSPIVRFWGWSENKREEEMDLEELRNRASQGLPLYGTSYQPDWVQQAANRNSQWSQLKFCLYNYLSSKLVTHLSLYIQQSSLCEPWQDRYY